jgi:hypothetical protein
MKKFGLFWSILIFNFHFFLIANDGSEMEDEISPRQKEQVNRSNFTDFCVKNIDSWELGRKEIEIAEQGL